MDGPSNDALLRQMARAAEHFDADVERDLVRAVASAQLVVPMRADPATGESGLWATSDPDGRTLVSTFTDAAALTAWAGQETPHAVVPGPELARIAVSADAAALWINPAGPHGGRLERYMVDVVAAGETLAFVSGDADERSMRLTTTGHGELRVRRPSQRRRTTRSSAWATRSRPRRTSTTPGCSRTGSSTSCRSPPPTTWPSPARASSASGSGDAEARTGGRPPPPRLRRTPRSAAAAAPPPRPRQPTFSGPPPRRRA